MITTALGHGNGVHWPRFRDLGHGEMDTTPRRLGLALISKWRLPLVGLSNLSFGCDRLVRIILYRQAFGGVW